MSGQGVPVTKAGKCERVMYAGADPHTIKHSWAPHERGLKLVSTLVDTKVGKKGKSITGYPDANEVALSKMAREKADELMEGKRKAAQRRGQQQARGGGGADSTISCPVIAAILASQSSGSRTRTSFSGTSSAKPSADPEVREKYSSGVRARARVCVLF